MSNTEQTKVLLETWEAIDGSEDLQACNKKYNYVSLSVNLSDKLQRAEHWDHTSRTQSKTRFTYIDIGGRACPIETGGGPPLIPNAYKTPPSEPDCKTCEGRRGFWEDDTYWVVVGDGHGSHGTSHSVLMTHALKSSDWRRRTTSHVHVIWHLHLTWTSGTLKSKRSIDILVDFNEENYIVFRFLTLKTSWPGIRIGPRGPPATNRGMNCWKR